MKPLFDDLSIAKSGEVGSVSSFALRSKAHRYHVACQRGTIAETSLTEARVFITTLLANVGWWSGWGTLADHRPTLSSNVVASPRTLCGLVAAMASAWRAAW
jgi:hypothetical protein